MSEPSSGLHDGRPSPEPYFTDNMSRGARCAPQNLGELLGELQENFWSGEVSTRVVKMEEGKEGVPLGPVSSWGQDDSTKREPRPS